MGENENRELRLPHLHRIDDIFSHISSFNRRRSRRVNNRVTFNSHNQFSQRRIRNYFTNVPDDDDDDFSSDNESDADDNNGIRINRASKNHGNYKKYFRGRLIVGPDRWIFITFTCILILLLVNQIGLHLFEHFERQGTPKTNYYISYALWLFSIYFTIRAGTTDPGVIPKNVTCSHFYSGDNRGIEIEWRRKRCFRCSCTRPARTYHCPHCDICIRLQDMHHPYIGTCIGERNRHLAFFMNFFLVTLSVFIFTTNILFLKAAFGNKSETNSEKWNIKVSLSFINLIISLSIFCIPHLGVVHLLYKVYLISNNRTIREEFEMLFTPERSRKRASMTPDSFKTIVLRFWVYLSPPGYKSYFVQGNQVGNLDVEKGSNQNRCSNNRRKRFQEALRGDDNDEENNNNLKIPRYVETVHNVHSCYDEDLENANSGKQKSFYSDPILNNGELKNLPNTRHKSSLHHKFLDKINSNVVNYYELCKCPRQLVESQFEQRLKVPQCLSLGSIVLKPWNSFNLNQEILYEARATQMRRIVELLRLRDRRGMSEMSRRINIPALFGVDGGVEIVEAHLGGGRSQFLLRTSPAALRLPQQVVRRGILALTQMTAAGLMSLDEGLNVRALLEPLPPHLQQNFILRTNFLPQRHYPTMRRDIIDGRRIEVRHRARALNANERTNLIIRRNERAAYERMINVSPSLQRIINQLSAGTQLSIRQNNINGGMENNEEDD